MFPFLLAVRTGLFAEGRFLGRLLDEWADDAQEFIHTKLPHLLVVAAIAFVLIRILRAITSHMTRIAEQHAAGPARIAQVKTLAGVIRATGLATIGLIAGIFCCFMVFEVKSRLGYDDSLDAFGVHGAGGTIGALLTGLFAASVINPIFKGAAGNPLPSGAIDGHWTQLLNQSAGVVIAWGISIVGTLVLLFVVDKIIGLRVSAEHESAGLDLSQHGEEGYDLNS